MSLSDDLAKSMIELKEQQEPMFEAAKGMRISLKKQGWSEESADAVAREWLIGVIQLAFRPPSSPDPDQPI